MKKSILLLPLLLLLFGGCSDPPRSPELVLPAFWKQAAAWNKSGEGAEQACQFLSERVLRVYRETEDPCRRALEDALPPGKIKSIEAIGKSERVEVGTRGSIWVQTVLVVFFQGKEERVLRAESAAPLAKKEDWAILSLQGMRLETMTLQGIFGPRDAAALALLGR